MPSLKEQIAALITTSPGLTDRELTDRLLGTSARQQPVNQAARSLAGAGRLQRRTRPDGKIGNYLANAGMRGPEPRKSEAGVAGPSEDEVKRAVEAWLRAAGWQVAVKWGRDRGIDIEAVRNDVRWIIEAKGCGSRDQMRVNYFLSMLGELLQRMNEERAHYSIALPDMKQFRGLWARLPELAKSRTRISALFVDAAGTVEEVGSGHRTAV